MVASDVARRLLDDVVGVVGVVGGGVVGITVLANGVRLYTVTLHMITLQTVKNFHFSSSLVTACNAVSTPVLLYTTVRVSE